MKQGKFQKNHPRRRRSSRAVMPLILALLVLTISTGTTLAYLMDKTSGVENTFTPAEVSCTVNDDMSITNNSNVKAYIRAMVIVNWMDDAGNVYGIAPSYTATAVTGWTQDEDTDIYYYTSPVDSHDSISAPVTVECNQEAPAEDYKLSIEVVAEAIQAEGMGASDAANAWSKAQTLPDNG